MLNDHREVVSRESDFGDYRNEARGRVFLKNGWHRIQFALRVEKRVTRWSDTYVSVVGELIGREDREAGVWLGDGFELEE